MQLRKMQTLKKEHGPVDTSSNVDKVMVLKSTSAEVSEELSTNEEILLTEASSGKSKSSACRRKRKFIPDEKKDAMYWEKRRKNNEAAKRSREKRRLNDLVLENKLIALGEENATLKAELLALKLKFGLITSAAYAQEIQKLSSSTAVYFQDYQSSKSNINSFVDEHEPSIVDSSCISVIKHSPQSSMSDMSEISSVEHTQSSCMQNNCRSPEKKFQIIKQEPMELEREPRDDRSSHKASIYSHYVGTTFNMYLPSPLFQVKRSSSNSPRTSETDDAAVGKSSDGEDEQQVPKGPIHSPVEHKNICATVKVPEVNSSALPHKLRIKAKAMQVKVEAVDNDYDAAQKLSSPIDMSSKRHVELETHTAQELVHSSCTPFSVQVTNIQDWPLKPELWHQKELNVRIQSGCKTEVVEIKDSIFNVSESENLYLKLGIANLSAEVASLKRLINTQQISTPDSG
ncbi:nuclear factor interleukin-3-regulated protein-like [Falco biarmicus]|uniref:nuclear factor interleukin-3-regulated protein-like n=1 Tax=Falco rusticolus TaxID=120794 RepID=UPI0018866249|nr:nuclear factor interleukin-3-regulated protein-like [Falco rusticolus]XP_037228225.1 nuclear factor interleukin-3-regulated protein-like [Falco rusticolus]XP_037228226.1 nuclear factor interleukin-3-regulated protein-like [Falco rusticolus]XP_055556127.1 nuclear factor interleukin-3-regulated protein-like [Falco cherrug]XP_055556128.1 nuclear factor interleukin-3-regulated protein-like [Falco cherrug]XP_055556130.1 nuclear factor interleukin-3-regulated protein-like [Falco cherrug]XP_05564